LGVDARRDATSGDQVLAPGVEIRSEGHPAALTEPAWFVGGVSKPWALAQYGQDQGKPAEGEEELYSPFEDAVLQGEFEVVTVEFDGHDYLSVGFRCPIADFGFFTEIGFRSRVDYL
jgi:hypothetical protein